MTIAVAFLSPAGGPAGAFILDYSNQAHYSDAHKFWYKGTIRVARALSATNQAHGAATARRIGENWPAAWHH